ncbi:MAG: 4-hydroxyphenylpyruvate dioxygenase [Acidobacteriota bacterium]
MTEDFCPIQAFDHVEFYVGNAKQAAQYYERCFGFTNTFYKGLETGEREVASYIMDQGAIRLILTTALSPDHPISHQVHRHGDGVGRIGLRVPDARAAFAATVERGAEAAEEPRVIDNGNSEIVVSAIKAYGDTLFEFVERDPASLNDLPGFEKRNEHVRGSGAGLTNIDHIVGNVELGKMNEWVNFFANTLGFSQLAHFDDDAISTEYSALMSKVMQDGSGKIKFPINEPADGRKKSQIEEYLEYYGGPGVQHIACATRDIIGTVRALRDGGVEFLQVPTTYYEELESRVGKIDEDVDTLAELGILVDRDDDGYLLQIFTQPVEDRPTVFYEVIERHGARGFGEGNFKSLFEAIEREQAARGNL